MPRPCSSPLPLSQPSTLLDSPSTQLASMLNPISTGCLRPLLYLCHPHRETSASRAREHALSDLPSNLFDVPSLPSSSHSATTRSDSTPEGAPDLSIKFSIRIMSLWIAKLKLGLFRKVSFDFLSSLSSLSSPSPFPLTAFATLSLSIQKGPLHCLWICPEGLFLSPPKGSFLSSPPSPRRLSRSSPND